MHKRYPYIIRCPIKCFRWYTCSNTVPPFRELMIWMMIISYLCSSWQFSKDFHIHFVICSLQLCKEGNFLSEKSFSIAKGYLISILECSYVTHRLVFFSSFPFFLLSFLPCQPWACFSQTHPSAFCSVVLCIAGTLIHSGLESRLQCIWLWPRESIILAGDWR